MRLRSELWNAINEADYEELDVVMNKLLDENIVAKEKIYKCHWIVGVGFAIYYIISGMQGA